MANTPGSTEADDAAIRNFLLGLLRHPPEPTGLFKHYSQRPDAWLPKFMRQDDE